MTATTAYTGGRSRNFVLAAMIFAVAMTFIDQTIVSIAAPNVQDELHLSSTGIQWAINAYLLSLAALFALGGRLADTLGHKKMVTIGVILFAAASGMCGLTPDSGIAEAWIVTFRVIQGVGGALLFPAALAIVVQTFELRQRGKALAIFFGVAGGLTAIGPILGGYLTEWTWRAIFWVNIPVAIIALIMIYISNPQTQHERAKIDYRGTVLIAAGIALSIFGFQQSATWGWSDPRVIGSLVIGAAILVIFYFVEQRTEQPLMQVSIFKIRPFLVQNIVLAISMLCFVPIFFFASEYAQISLGDSASSAGTLLLYFFIGFVIAAQIAGRMMDKGGAKRPVVIGCIIAAVGFYLWGGDATSLSFGDQQWDIIIAGAGMGAMLGPASTDAVNRASRLSYGEATGITQTIRNYAAALGLAILGNVLVNKMHDHLVTSLLAQGASQAKAEAEASQFGSGGSGGGSVTNIPHFVRLDFAQSTQTVLYSMAGIMAAAAIVAIVGLRSGAQEQENLTPEDIDAQAAAGTA